MISNVEPVGPRSDEQSQKKGELQQEHKHFPAARKGIRKPLVMRMGKSCDYSALLPDDRVRW